MKNLLLLAALVGATACAPVPVRPPAQPAQPVEAVAPEPVAPPAPPPPDNRSLFERLGGLPAITAVTAELLARSTTDPRIKDRFFNTDSANLQKLLVEMLCQATGGPCTYTGRDMESSHAGMELVDEEFVALVEHLGAALDKFEVGGREKSELLGALGPMQPQIVAPKDQLRPVAEERLAAAGREVVALGPLDAERRRLLEMAVLAARRGQRSYAEQLFTRAELGLGAGRLAPLAAVFRDGAPPRVATATAPATDSGPQPQAVGKSDDDTPAPPRLLPASLRGTLQVGGGPVGGLGVIMLTPERGAKKRAPKRRVVEQRDKIFAPHILAVPVGSTVEFPNFDKVFHNVFSLSTTSPFDLGMYKPGEQREVKLDKPGVVRLGCNIHAGMSAYIVVVDAPHYVVVDADGGFAFRSLKPGAYTLRAWSERTAVPAVSRIVIKPGVNQQVIDLAGDAAPGPGPGKFGDDRGAAATPARP